jgi:hypothetical protein
MAQQVEGFSDIASSKDAKFISHEFSEAAESKWLCRALGV